MTQREILVSDTGAWIDKSARQMLGAIHSMGEHGKVYARIKPAATHIQVNGIKVPAPLREAPEEGADIFVASPAVVNPDQHNALWRGTPQHLEWLKRGLVHTTSDAAQAHSRAMVAYRECDE